ncbi:neutral zinc metallopeptidase [Umezawaea beigongshangensis]|uniref:neutral zinc metallopeptidase n=1 Tax=Umezawaea beigongshangensis TaxID=2780383 RepID=UPI0018F27396|nr:neutral zinc metallopeptidase [Umezawaea beigongshangensis]
MVRQDGAERNDPVVLAGVFVLVVGAVLALGLATRGTESRVISGFALPVADSSRPRAAQRVAGHQLMTSPVSLTPVTCELPRFDQDDARLRLYYEAGLTCLSRAWEPVLTAGGTSPEPARLDTTPGTEDGPCGAAPGGEEVVAYYCGSDRTVHMITERLREVGGDAPTTHLATLAHEYGHHVQAVSGLLRAAQVDGATDLEMSRRVELQADCFAGMFLAAAHGSIGADLVALVLEDFGRSAGEDPADNTHGSGSSRARWVERGLAENSTAACNTFAAPASEIG